MANALYDLARQAFLDADIDWSANNIKAVLVDTAMYTVNLATHQFLSDIAAGARLNTSGNLASKDSTAGVADAADVTFTGGIAASAEAVVLYVDTGVAGTSRLIAYIDTATGLPAAITAGDVIVQWSDGASKIFKL
jgi:hypothetical protein